MDIRRFGAAVPLPRLHARPERSRSTRPTTTSTTRTRSARPGGRCASSPAYGRAGGARGRRSARRRLGAAELVRAERGGAGCDGAARSGRAAGPASTGGRRSAPRRWRRGRRRGCSTRRRFAKIEVAGPGAAALLQWLCANDVDRAGRRVTYTQLLNRRGGIECDLTVTRLAPDRFLLVTGTAFGNHDLGWIRAARCRADGVGADPRPHRRPGRASALWGPRARDILGRRRRRRPVRRRVPVPDRPRDHASATCPCFALRVTYVGELGWELYRPPSTARALWDTLWDAGAPHGIVARRLPGDRRPAAREGLPRLGRRHHARGDAVRGRPRVRGRARQGATSSAATRWSRRRRPAPRKRLRCLVLDDPRSVCLGNEPVRIDGEIVGPGDVAAATASRVERTHRLRLPAARRRDRERGARSTCSATGSASRSRASRCTTRPARGSGREQGIIGAMTDAGRGSGRPGRRRAPAPRRAARVADFALAVCDDRRRDRARAHFRRDLDLERKPDRLVRDGRRPGDRARDPGRIRDRCPDHGLVGEEYGEEAGRAATRWYIDPIDGTHNFMRGMPLFGTLLGGRARRRDAGRRDRGARDRRALVRVARWRRLGRRRPGAAGAPDPRLARSASLDGRAAPLRAPCATSRRSACCRRFEALLARGLARPRLRRLLGLCAGRRGRRRGDDGAGIAHRGTSRRRW